MDYNLPDGISPDVTFDTVSEVVMSTEFCDQCGTEFEAVEVIRTEFTFHYNDTWTCPICAATHITDIDYADDCD